jgi:ribosomal-protein-serine acetyltransferase
VAWAPANMDVIKITESLELRPLHKEHAPALFALTDRNRVYLRKWLPWLDHTRVENDSLCFIHSSIKAAAEGSRFTLGLWKDDTLCGIVSFNEIDRTNQIGTLGYWLGSEYTGRGLMTQAVRTLGLYGFTKMNLNRIVIKVATANRQSQAIPDRLGFTREGILREAEWLYDHYVDLTVNSLLKKETAPALS